MELLIDRELTVTAERLERLHQAILFYADSVKMRATAAVPDSRPDVLRRMREFREIGALTTWAHEYEVNDGGRVRSDTWRSMFDEPVDLVLPLPSARQLVDEVDSELQISDAALLVQPSSLREGIAEVVQFRRSLIGFRLADALSADGLLLGGRRANTTVTEVQSLSRRADEYSEVVNTIVDLCTFGSLSSLTIDTVVKCRRHMPAFRHYLDQKVESNDRVAKPRLVAREIVREYQDLLVEYARGHAVRDTAVDATWDVVGAILPPVVIVKYLGKPLSWSRRRRDFGPFLLLSQLRSHT